MTNYAWIQTKATIEEIARLISWGNSKLTLNWLNSEEKEKSRDE